MRMSIQPLPGRSEEHTTPQNIPCIGLRQLPASVARSHAVLALARGYSLTNRIAPGDTARLRVSGNAKVGELMSERNSSLHHIIT